MRCGKVGSVMVSFGSLGAVWYGGVRLGEVRCGMAGEARHGAARWVLVR